MASSETNEAEIAYKALMGVVGEYKASRYKSWVNSMGALDSSTLQAKLDKPLMKKTNRASITEREFLAAFTFDVKEIFLQCNFDQDLLSLFAEVQYWEKFRGEFSIPYYAHDLYNQKAKFYAMREHVMRIVDAYNKIMCDLSAEERRLFSDHIRKLDKRMNQGLQKLTWMSKGIIEHYVNDCCAHCAEVYTMVCRFKEGKQRISHQCRLASSMLLLQIDKNVTYAHDIFEATQAARRTEMKRRLQQNHEITLLELRAIFTNFCDGTTEVLREWRAFVKEIDSQVEAALRQTVKRSLQELSRAINGDAMSEPQTLFCLKLVLENGRIDYKPTMISLTHLVNIVAKELISTVAVVPRLCDILLPETGKLFPCSTADDKRDCSALTKRHQSFYSTISNDEDMLKIVVQIMNGMSMAATELQRHLGLYFRRRSIR